MHVSHLYLHPLKSGAPLCTGRLDIGPRGPEGDRRWMVVDADGRFLTGRQHGRLVLVRAGIAGDGLVLEAPGRPALRVPEPDGCHGRIEVSIWKDRVDAARADPEADRWLAELLGQPVHLVHMDDRARRPVSPEHARPGDEVSFADGFPLLILSARALDALSERVGRRMEATRFRPNILVGDCPAHAEDRWRRIRIGAVEFELPKPCTRCVFTTVDPSTGERDGDGEPLATLKHYRRGPEGITFGVNMIPRGGGTLRIGDPVVVLEAV